MLRPGAHSRWYPGRSANLVTLTAQKLPHLPFLTKSRTKRCKAALSRELAQRSCHGETLHRDPYRDLVQYRDLAKRSLTEILPRELSKRDCAAISATGLAKRPFIGSLYRDLAKRPLMEILHGDIA